MAYKFVYVIFLLYLCEKYRYEKLRNASLDINAIIQKTNK